MKTRLALVAALTLALPLLTAAAWGPSPAPRLPDTLAPEVASTLRSLGPGDMTTVVVTLKDQADLGALPRSRPARVKETVRALRAEASASQADLKALLRSRAAQGEVAETTPLWILNGVSVTATADVVRELASRPDVASVTSDEVSVVPAYGTPEPNQTQVNAPALWDLGHRGQGVVVASLDSGVDMSHADLSTRWRGGANSWFDPYGQHSTPTDLSGHGTATMGVMVGGDAGGTSIGTAPGAKWIAAKIFNDSGSATVTAIHQAFQWVLDPDGNPSTADAPQVVNGSWSLGSGPGCDLSFQPDLQALRAAGILPVFAAGNFGPGTSTSVSPANYPEALSVGAVNGQNAIYSGSSRGPTTCGGRSRAFPDIVAPGVSITTADRYGFYQVATGTSVAAPHAAGALALLLEARPALSADAQQAALVDGAVDLGVAGPDSTFGHGLLDVMAAYQSLQDPPDFAITATPGSRSIAAGKKTKFTVDVTPLNGFTGQVSLSAVGLPGDVGSATFTPSTLAGGGMSQLKIATLPTGPSGTYPLEVRAVNGSTLHSVGISLKVRHPAFSLSASPVRARPLQGRAAIYVVDVARLEGFTGEVRLSRSGLPRRVSTTWSPKRVTAPGSSTLRVKTTRSTPKGRYELVIVGKSQSLRHEVVVVLRVR